MRHVLIILAFVVTALYLVSPQPALACTTTPEGRPPYTLKDKVDATPIILEGTVTDFYQETHSFTATVSVLQYFKGSGPSEVTISNFGNGAQCLTMVNVGDHLIFFAAGDPNTGLRAFYMSAFASVSAVNSESIAALRHLLPQTLTPAPPVIAGTPIQYALKVIVGFLAMILQ